jgi:hypothetical protein
MVDESMFLADAMRANDAGYTPWLKFDNLTSGPLNSLPIAVLLNWGFPPNHILLHSFAAVLQAAGFVLLLLVAVKLAGTFAGTVIALGGAFLFALQQAPDFTHYSSGLVPFVLLVGGWMLALRPDGQGHLGTSLPRMFAAFVLFGMAPLAKTQAALPGLASCLGLAFFFLHQEVRSGRRCGRIAAGFALMALGGALPIAVAAWSVWHAGAAAYALGSIEAVGGYAGQSDPLKTLKDAVFFVLSADSRFLFAAVVASVFALVSYSVAVGERAVAGPFATSEAVLLAAMAAWLGSALFAAALPQTMAAIYEVFLYAPALLMIAALAGWLHFVLPCRDVSKAILLAGCFLAASFPLLAPALKKNLGSTDGLHSSLSMEAEHRVSEVLRGLKNPCDKLFVWGWAPAIYIHAGMTPGSRYSQAHLCTERFYSGPLFREALMSDLQASQPRFVVDAMQSGFAMNSLGTWIGYHEPSRDLSAQNFYPQLEAMGYRPVVHVPLEDGSEAIVYEREASAAKRTE